MTAISEKTHRALGKPQLSTPTKILRGPSQQALKTLGQLIGKFSHKMKTAEQHVFVVRGLKTNLLGLSAIIALGLAM